jgi:hypothetical protein
MEMKNKWPPLTPGADCFAIAWRLSPIGVASGSATRPTGSPSSELPKRLALQDRFLLIWAISPLPWEKGAQRFFTALQAFDAYLASDLPLLFPAEKLFQGPLADALTDIGQIGLLRRLAGAPVRGENYFRADIVAGRVGPEQSAPVREFV